MVRVCWLCGKSDDLIPCISLYAGSERRRRIHTLFEKSRRHVPGVAVYLTHFTLVERAGGVGGVAKWELRKTDNDSSQRRLDELLVRSNQIAQPSLPPPSPTPEQLINVKFPLECLFHRRSGNFLFLANHCQNTQNLSVFVFLF